jgi:hypothetical protein
MTSHPRTPEEQQEYEKVQAHQTDEPKQLSAQEDIGSATDIRISVIVLVSVVCSFNSRHFRVLLELV